MASAHTAFATQRTFVFIGAISTSNVAGEMNAGRHSFVWDAKDERGQQVVSGVYLYVIKASEFTAQKKLVLMK
jgi:hypothetical protein